MDDLILRAAIWHDEHWVDRSGLLKAESHHQTKTENASARVAKVVLLTFDRNRESLLSTFLIYTPC